MTLTYTGDLTATQPIEALENPASPGVIHYLNLAVGANTITVPTGNGATARAVTIVPPPGNTHALLLKALPGDTGISLHVTDPTTIALDPTVTSFVLEVATAILGVRLFWS
jgi:hypothetical protein